MALLEAEGEYTLGRDLARVVFLSAPRPESWRHDCPFRVAMVIPPGSRSGSARGPKLLVYLVILLVILLFLGGDRIASTGRGLGEAIRGFKKGLRGEEAKPKAPSVRQKVPKLLPAKGESSAQTEPDAESDTEKDP